jgi:hypothetical protein
MKGVKVAFYEGVRWLPFGFCELRGRMSQFYGAARG